MAQKCAVIGCQSKKGEVEFFKFPGVHYEPYTNRKSLLSKNRRTLWIEALKRGNFIREDEKICSKHFFTGQPAPSEWTDHIDWVPSLNMGHGTTQNRDMNVIMGNKEEIPIISLDSDEEDGSKDATVNFKDTIAGSPSSTTITATSSSSESGNERKNATSMVQTNYKNATSNINNKGPVGKIFVSKSIFKSPDKMVPNCPPLVPIQTKRKLVKILPKILPNNKVVETFKQSIPSNHSTKSMTNGSSTKNQEKKVLYTQTGKQNIKSVQKTKKAKIGPKSFMEKNKMVVPFEFPKERIIQEQKIFVPVSQELASSSSNSVRNTLNNLESDPLYIPNEKDVNAPNKTNKPTKKKTPKKCACCTHVANRICKCCTDPSKPSTSSHTCKHKSLKTKKDPSKSEHLIVKNYAVQNIATMLTKSSKTNSKIQTCINNNCKKYLMAYNNPLNTDCCRNFFIKNSAWDFLETDFKGFNEREKEISKTCTGCLGKLIQNMRKGEHKFSFSSTKGGKVQKKRAEVSYRYPPTKRCSIVIRRNDLIERKVKRMMLQEKLDSYTLLHLNFSPKDVKKPLIILNKQNFNILRVNDALIKYSNVVYVKDSDEEFSDHVLGNPLIVKHIERGGMKVVSPEALRNFMCNSFFLT